jgi:acid phosphatase type 7
MVRIHSLPPLGLAAALLQHAFAASNATTPMQVRLAYAGPNGMTVSWNTYEHLAQPAVYYGTYVAA